VGEHRMAAVVPHCWVGPSQGMQPLHNHVQTEGNTAQAADAWGNNILQAVGAGLTEARQGVAALQHGLGNYQHDSRHHTLALQDGRLERVLLRNESLYGAAAVRRDLSVAVPDS
jgi:hypothetical protein